MLALFASSAGAEDFSDWQDLGTSKGVALAERENSSNGLSEYRAQSVLDVPIEVLRKVLSEVDESADFMPYVEEVKVLQRSPGRILFYQRIKPPFVSERDYTLLFTESEMETPHGTGYRLAWRTANAEGPPEKDGIVRVALNTGSWDLTPTADSSKTDLVYRVCTSVGNSVPAFIAKKGNQMALPKIIEAVRERAKQNAR